MKIKYSFLTLLAFIVVGCSEPDPMKESYIQDCSADGAAAETCSCLFDYGKENMNETEFMSSDFTHAYRKKTNTPIPGAGGSLIIADPECGFNDGDICEFLDPADPEKVASIVMNAMDACF